MGELRGNEPDVAPRPPDKREPSGDRPPEPPTDSNNDPRAIWRTMRKADHPAFALDPRVAVQYVTDSDPTPDPASPRTFRTSKDRPQPESESDEPALRAPDIEQPSGDELLEKDAPGGFDGFQRQLFKNVEDVHDATKDVSDFVDHVLDRPSPTGHHVEVRPRETIAFPTPKPALDTGETVATMVTVGIVVGELARRAYHKAAESRERRNAGIG